MEYFLMHGIGELKEIFIVDDHDHPDVESTNLEEFRGILNLTVNPLEYQRAIRDEWESTAF